MKSRQYISHFLFFTVSPTSKRPKSDGIFHILHSIPYPQLQSGQNQTVYFTYAIPYRILNFKAEKIERYISHTPFHTVFSTSKQTKSDGIFHILHSIPYPQLQSSQNRTVYFIKSILYGPHQFMPPLEFLNAKKSPSLPKEMKGIS